MGILLTIFFIALSLYSIIGGIMFIADYVSTPIVGKNDKEKNRNFSKSNVIFLKRLFRYTLIVCIPAYFWQDLENLIGSNIDVSEYSWGLLALPLFIWANAIIMIISIFFDFFPKKIKSIYKKK